MQSKSGVLSSVVAVGIELNTRLLSMATYAMWQVHVWVSFSPSPSPTLFLSALVDPCGCSERRVDDGACPCPFPHPCPRPHSSLCPFHACHGVAGCAGKASSLDACPHWTVRVWCALRMSPFTMAVEPGPRVADGLHVCRCIICTWRASAV